ncbi:DUF5615 family PIN-like protein [Thermofilum sp.]|jgi:predicted nuclease of predicted toxin-antitoxin system|uniref:DUF5615 family PIN-like protein n=1 Tax=Thermofilum sp. TaxID=1961369 RepID=UPI00338ECEBF
MLKFLLDENVPRKVKEFLESVGYVAEYSTKGLKNSQLASIAISGKYVLVTRDSDFANTILYPPGQFNGIIVLRVHPPRAEKLIEGISGLNNVFMPVSTMLKSLLKALRRC